MESNRKEFSRCGWPRIGSTFLFPRLLVRLVCGVPPDAVSEVEIISVVVSDLVDALGRDSIMNLNPTYGHDLPANRRTVPVSRTGDERIPRTLEYHRGRVGKNGNDLQGRYSSRIT